MPAESETVIRRWFAEVWNERRMESIPELFAAHGVAHGLAEGGADDVHGPDEFRVFVDNMLREFDDFRITIADVIADGEKAAARWTASGRYRGSVLAPGSAAGREVRMTGMSFVRVRDGRIQEGWNNWDIMGMMCQLGSAPAVSQLRP